MNIRQILRPSFQQQVTAAERKPQKKSSLSRQSTDRTSWSRQALAYIEEQNRRVWEKDVDAEGDGDPALKQLEKDRKRQDKCLIIASRLRHGDRIPPEDEAYLMKTDPAGYLLALSQRVENPHPRKWESILDEEDLKEAAGFSGAEAIAAAGSGTITGPVGGPDGPVGGSGAE